MQLRRAREGAGPDAGRAGASSGAAGSRGAGRGPGLLTSVEHLAIVRQRLIRQRQEFEQFLERVVGDGDGRGGVMLLVEDLKGLMDKHLSRVRCGFQCSGMAVAAG